MKIRNIAQCDLMHIKGDKTVRINAGEEKDIPDDIAKLWLATNKVVKVDDGKKEAEIARLKAENEKLKAKVAKKSKK